MVIHGGCQIIGADTLATPSLKTSGSDQLRRFHGRLRHRALAPGPSLPPVGPGPSDAAAGYPSSERARA